MTNFRAKLDLLRFTYDRKSETLLLIVLLTFFRLLTSCHEWQVMEVVLVFDEFHEVSKASLNPDSCPANLFLGQVKYGPGADPLQLQIGRLQMVHNLAHKPCETIEFSISRRLYQHPHPASIKRAKFISIHGLPSDCMALQSSAFPAHSWSVPIAGIRT